VFYGGVPIVANRTALKDNTPHVIVGTPGRILALLRSKDLKMDKLKHFVLDECDRMLEAVDMRRDVQEIFRASPHQKQVMMFSATLSKEIRPICKKFCQDPMEIYVDDDTKLTLHGLQQYYVKLAEAEKNRKLNDLLDALEFNQVVIFVSKVARAKELDRLLQECNFPSVCIHSGLSQDERITRCVLLPLLHYSPPSRRLPPPPPLPRYKDFKDFKKRILVSTDLFGRGIDIERVNIVINYDFPENKESPAAPAAAAAAPEKATSAASDQYLHRVGRAGRFGTKGLAISFISSADDATELARVQSRFEVDVGELPDTLAVSTYMTS